MEKSQIDSLSEEDRKKIAEDRERELELIKDFKSKKDFAEKAKILKEGDVVIVNQEGTASIAGKEKSAKVESKAEQSDKAKEKKVADKAKIEATRIAIERETERVTEEAELLKGGAEYSIDEKGNKKLELTREQTEKIEADKKAEEQEKIAKIQAERYGIKDVSVMKNIGKGGFNAVLSILGARFPIAAAELYTDIKNKRGAKVATSELLETITLKNAQANEGNEQPLTESKIERNKTLKEAELIKGGAKYYFDDNGERKISLTKKQLEGAKKKTEAKLEEDKRTKGMLEKKTVNTKSPGNWSYGGVEFTTEKTREIGPVQQRIQALNEKLKAMDMPATEKKELRSQMAVLLNEHRHDSNKLEAQKVEKVSRVFDVYANSSSKVMGVAKEAVNTATIAFGMPWLRSAGYALFSGAESFMKAGNVYDKKHFKDGEVNTKEKLSYIGKSLTIDAAKETCGIYTNLLKKETYKDKKTFSKAVSDVAGKTASIFFTGLRVFGIYKAEQQLMAGNNVLSEGGEKLVASLAEGRVGEALRQGGENWIHNVQYMASLVGIGNNPSEAGKVAPDNVQDTKPAYTATGGNTEKPSFTINEKSTEVLAGEGPQHAIGRQVKDNLQNFGFKGDIKDGLAVAKFVTQKTHEIVTQNELDDVGIREVGTHINLASNGVVSGLTPENTYNLPSGDAIANDALIKQTVMDDNINSLIPNTESLSGNGENMVPEFSRAMQFDQHIKDDIFHIQSSGTEGLVQWDKVQDISASEILAHKYGDLTKSEYYDPSGSNVASAKLHYDRLADEIQSLSVETPINENESVSEYFKRVNGIRSFDLTDYIENPSVAEHLRTQSVANKIKDIFHHWYDRDSAGDKQWDSIKKMSVKDALDGKFGKWIHGADNIAERSSRGGIQDLLQSTLKKTPMLDKETVEAFIIRANKILSIEI